MKSLPCVVVTVAGGFVAKTKIVMCEALQTIQFE